MGFYVSLQSERRKFIPKSTPTIKRSNNAQNIYTPLYEGDERIIKV